MRGIFSEAKGKKRKVGQKISCWNVLECVVFQPQAPDDGTLVAEHEDNFSSPQLCA